ncbi:MAG TPA: ATP-binding protein [Vicinamibacterales bacterium]|nr:ATP-binding protein [Vicinamibacterales bacterium]
MAHATRPTDLLPHLHQRALDVAGGDCSLLFQLNPRDGSLQATSGVGVEALPIDPWIPGAAGVGPEEADLVTKAFVGRTPVFVTDLQARMPDLWELLQRPAVLLIPLVRDTDRVGLLAVGFRASPPSTAVPADVSQASDAFLLALELFRHRQQEELHGDLRALLDQFTSSLSENLNITAGLDIFCGGANRLFGADRTSVWIHDRRARRLVLRASSAPEHSPENATVAADDSTAIAAVAMRHARPEIAAGGPEGHTATVTVPLRGTRRALGTIVFEGVRLDPGGELDALDRADALGRQLASAIENTQLLDDVIRSRRELENTFDSIAHLVAVSDSRGAIVHANRAFATRVGRAREQLLNQSVFDYIGPELGAWLRRIEAEPAKGDDATTIGITDAVLNGSFIVTVTALVDQEGGRAGSVIVARDLTAQTQLEAEREALRKRLLQSEKLAALGQFVAGIAHELNNPLQGVLGPLELLRTTGAIPKPLRRELQGIYREAERAAKIVRNLLVFAGSRRLTLRAVSLPAVLQKVLALRAKSIRNADIEVVRHYDEPLPRVQSDPLLLHQVFLNLVMNAEQAIVSTGGGGRIEIGAKASGDRVVATVRDTGSGIPEEALPRVFEPFYTTKEVGKGTGLGLAIAYGIVQDHGGQISAANHPDGGAMLTVELPAAPAARAAMTVRSGR